MNSDGRATSVRLLVKVLACAFFFAFWAVLWITISPPPAAAHDWYPVDCCSGHDCRPISDKEIQELNYSEVVDLVTGVTLRGGQIRQSQDGQWHMCNQGGKREGKPLCVFRPDRGF